MFVFVAARSEELASFYVTLRSDSIVKDGQEE